MVSLSAWRRGGGSPSDDDHRREDAFLDQHIASGALIHRTTTEALASALETEEDGANRERLALRIFAEYVNALETLGAWGWAIRNRHLSRLLLDAFLSYQPGDVKKFYEVVASHQGELSGLLRLPTTQEITDAFRQAGAPHGALLADFTRMEKNLRQASQHYFDPDALFVTNYNKAKHGAPIIHGRDLGPQEFYVLSPNPDGTTRYMFSKFSSAPRVTTHMVKLVEMVSNTTLALVSFARNLKTVGLL